MARGRGGRLGVERILREKGRLNLRVVRLQAFGMRYPTGYGVWSSQFGQKSLEYIQL